MNQFQPAAGPGDPSAAQAVGGSFRDPAGFVYRRDGVLYRQVNQVAAAEYERFVASGLAAALIDSGRLIPTTEVPLALAATADAAVVLQPEPISFVSYPYEWCPGQLRAAALLTLSVARTALDHGQVLRDATAYNVQWRGGQPIHIDTLSFGAWQAGQPWAAYRQFCQHFVAPLAAMCRVDGRLGQLLATHLDGLPLDLSARLLGRCWWRHPRLGLHVHLHAASQRRAAGAAGRPAPFSEASFRGLLDSLERLVRGLTWRSPGSPWQDYPETHQYSPAALSAKQQAVAAFVAAAPRGPLFDLGANAGDYSLLAARAGHQVVALDGDVAVVERHWRRLAAEPGVAVLPLVMDLANPSPALGWAGEERDSLAARGPATTALALALTHHLALGQNVPLEHLARWLRQLAHQVLVEFVPLTDPQAQSLVSHRAGLFPGYHRAGFEAALRPCFRLQSVTPLPESDRLLYTLEGRPA